jgi:hypothetical protein
MLKWFSEGSRLLAIAMVFATLVGAWMFRYEPIACLRRPSFPLPTTIAIMEDHACRHVAG